MGALAAYHSRSGDTDPDVVTRMLAAAPHRGERREVKAIGRTVLGVARADADGDASIAVEDGSAAAFVGALDNGPSLAADLRAAGVVLRDERPASILLAAFGAWGGDALRRMRGSFAGGFSDGSALTVFRDHQGTKPLFRRDDWAGFFAATEIKQVCAGAGIAREPDLDGLEAIFLGTVALGTAVRGVTRLGRGHLATANGAGEASTRRFWDPKMLLETRRCTADEAAEELGLVLERSVARCVSGNDVVLLSGGIDSPTVAAFAAEPHIRAAGRPLAALSAVFPDHPSVDESRYIEMVASRYGLDLHTYVPNAGVLDDVERWVDVADGPVDALSLPQVAEAYGAASGLGARRILTGELEEYTLELRHYLIDHLVMHGRFRAAGHLLVQQRAAGRRWRAIARDLTRALLPPRAAVAYARRHVQPSMVPVWIDSGLVRGGEIRPDLARPGSRRWSEMQVAPLAGAAITFEADEIVAATCGVEVRWPFADVDLWEFALSLPAEVKFAELTRKGMLKRAMRGRLPDEILDRRDQTVFDEYSVSRAEYGELRRLLTRPSIRMRGVDYPLLSERIERAEMTLPELQWARDLARVHAFIEVCS